MMLCCKTTQKLLLIPIFVKNYFMFPLINFDGRVPKYDKSLPSKPVFTRERAG